MNMPPPSAAKPFSKSSKTISKHINIIAKKSVADAAAVIRKSANAQETDVNSSPVSCDGTWQRRGFSSLNGCVTIMSIDTGKVLDTEASSRCCKQCQQHSHLDKESEEYRLWKADHTNWKANFKGSAPAMEPEGAERMFKWSVETHKLRYSELYQDDTQNSSANKRCIPKYWSRETGMYWVCPKESWYSTEKIKERKIQVLEEKASWLMQW